MPELKEEISAIIPKGGEFETEIDGIDCFLGQMDGRVYLDTEVTEEEGIFECALIDFDPNLQVVQVQNYTHEKKAEALEITDEIRERCLYLLKQCVEIAKSNKAQND
ncbi:hypothetical protein ACFL2V_18410 [Pseudomonadota bacterium]